MYRWDGGQALVQTVDFFTPIVDDPYLYGQIAAANALSDVYAMGGRPLTALAIAGFPKRGPGRDVLRTIFEGGLEKLREAGVSLLGGHTVEDAEIKFGYAVTGAIDPERVLSNNGARSGDVLLLTKPLGTGIVGTAIKYRRAPADVADAAVRSMTALNRDAAEALRQLPATHVHACTDITGYGLIGHASEIAGASGVTLHLESRNIPLIDGVRTLVGRNRTRGGDTNKEYFEGRVEVGGGIDADLLALLYDPQTSGGLLIAVDPSRADAVFRALGETGRVWRVGEVTAHDGSLVRVR